MKDLLTRFLCHFGYHTGKFDSGVNHTSRSQEPDGTIEKTFYLRQKKFCLHCGALEIRDTKIGNKFLPPWSRAADNGE